MLLSPVVFNNSKRFSLRLISFWHISTTAKTLFKSNGFHFPSTDPAEANKTTTETNKKTHQKKLKTKNKNKKQITRMEKEKLLYEAF